MEPSLKNAVETPGKGASLQVNRFMQSVLLIGVSVVLLAGITGCSTHYRDGPPVYSSAYYHYPYRYHYYPGTQVYFHITSGDYYYRDGTHWRRTRELPKKHRLDRHDRVPLWIDTEKPHARHNEHQKHYKPSPRYRRDSARDPEERRHNKRMHERYRKNREWK